MFMAAAFAKPPAVVSTRPVSFFLPNIVSDAAIFALVREWRRDAGKVAGLLKVISVIYTSPRGNEDPSHPVSATSRRNVTAKQVICKQMLHVFADWWAGTSGMASFIATWVFGFWLIPPKPPRTLFHAVIYGARSIGTGCYNIARCRQWIRAERLFVRVHNVQRPDHSETNPACWPPDSQTAGSGFGPLSGCDDS